MEQETPTARKTFLTRLRGRIIREARKLHPRAILWKIKYNNGRLQPVITRLGKDLKIRVWSDDIIAQELYVNGYFESGTCLFVEKFLKKGMVVIDAGANAGQYTLISANKVGPSGKVHSFEPSPRMFDELRFNVNLNKLDTTCELNNYALSDSAGTAQLSRYEAGKEVYGSLGNHCREDGGAIIGHDEVKTISLDEYIHKMKIERIDLIKMDIEGAELLALKGSQEILSRPDGPALIIEIADINTEGFGYKGMKIWDHLESFDYKMHIINEKGCASKEAQRPVEFAKTQNFLALKKVLY